MAKRKLRTPYVDLLPPLSTVEREALAASIAREGVHTPIVVDQHGNVLDGHHRLAIDPKAPRRVVEVKSEAHGRAQVYQSNFARRNLSSAQEKVADKARKAIARELNEAGETQATIAALLGCSQQTVSRWVEAAAPITHASNRRSAPTTKRDCRVKVPPSAKPEIAARVEAGESQAQVAADLGVGRQHVSRICTEVAKQKARVEERQASVKKLAGDTVGIHHGDFRELGSVVHDASVDLVFTDPPYPKEHIPLYSDLASFAARVLKPGGWCLAYCPQTYFPEILDRMRKHLTYGWTFCILHSGGDPRFRKFKLYNGWKPLVGFYRPPLSVHWDWFKDSASGGREKDDHEWQQAEGEARHFISSLTVKGAVVCDPFCGSGTTCVAAKATGRQWIGFEIDADHSETARVRLA